jgi:hypothetical protein
MAATDRITGRDGAVYLGSTPTIVLDVYDWAFTATNDVLECDIKGDKYHKSIPGAGGAKFTAKRRVEASSVFAAMAIDEATNHTQNLFRLDLISNNGSYTQIQGQGYVSSGSLTAPRDAVDDSIEITFDGLYSMS